MPMSEDFQKRLLPHLSKIVNFFGTPFHIYDEQGILDTCRKIKEHFVRISPDFQEYFAVKANPNPFLLKIIKSAGFGFDCSSVPELLLASYVGAKSNEIMFTSNNTSLDEFLAVAQIGAILNLDDITLIDKVPQMPELICFRYNPGPRRTGNNIIGNPVEAKYGVAHDQIIDAYKLAIARGAKRFGLHTMICSNELNYQYFIDTAAMLLDLVQIISHDLKIRFEFINLGGGLGIPYIPYEKPLDLKKMTDGIGVLLDKFKADNGYVPALFIESGRYITGPHGVLVTRCINQKHIYREYRQVDACMSSLMRPALYNAYHHITVAGKEKGPKVEIVDVVGSLCENNDKFAVQRLLPKIVEGDILIIQDTGAHGYAMCFQYNGRLRPQELLLTADGRVVMIRRAETYADYTATLNFEEKTMKL